MCDSSHVERIKVSSDLLNFVRQTRCNLFHILTLPLKQKQGSFSAGSFQTETSKDLKANLLLIQKNLVL